MRQFVREIPPEARSCSSRLAAEDWGAIDRQITNTVDTAFAAAGQPHAENSAEHLNKVIKAWSKCGFRISDKSTCSKPTNKIALPAVVWTEQDRRDFANILQPALKSKTPLIAEKVATGIVHFTIIKEQRGEGWGYEYLRKWLMDQFSIKCGKREKQAAVIRACQDLHLIKRTRLGQKGHASQWTVGSRALARLNGDMSDQWTCVFDHKDQPRLDEGRRLLDANSGEITLD